MARQTFSTYESFELKSAVTSTELSGIAGRVVHSLMQSWKILVLLSKARVCEFSRKLGSAVRRIEGELPRISEKGGFTFNMRRTRRLHRLTL